MAARSEGPGSGDSRSGADGLSQKAKELRRRIAEGRYEVDLEALASRLLECDALDDGRNGSPSHEPSVKATGAPPPVDDEKPESD